MKLAAAYKWNGTLQTTKINDTKRPRGKKVKKKALKEMAAEHNRPRDLLLDRMMMTMTTQQPDVWYRHIPNAMYSS